MEGERKFGTIQLWKEGKRGVYVGGMQERALKLHGSGDDR